MKVEMDAVIQVSASWLLCTQKTQSRSVWQLNRAKQVEFLSHFFPRGCQPGWVCGVIPAYAPIGIHCTAFSQEVVQQT